MNLTKISKDPIQSAVRRIFPKSEEKVEEAFLSPKELEDLEGMIDKAGLATVLGQISEICMAKADHIRSNWQDEGLAKEWEKFGEKLSKFSSSSKPPR